MEEEGRKEARKELKEGRNEERKKGRKFLILLPGNCFFGSKIGVGALRNRV